MRPVWFLSGALLAAAVAPLAAHALRQPESALARVARDPRRLVEPGPLAAAHAAVAECRDCYACHALLESIPDGKCLTCHEAIGERLRQKSGHHGRDLDGRCRECHADHREPLVALDESRFDHGLALYPLAGAHAAVECAGCHGGGVERRYIGIASRDCADCHDDPHRGSADRNHCADCHAPAGWTVFSAFLDHAVLAGRALDATHAPLACAACHAAGGFRSAPDDCAGCHVDVAAHLRGEIAVEGVVERGAPSPHSGLVACTDCHESGDAKPPPAVYEERCARCHTARYADLQRQRTEYLAGLAAGRGDARTRALRRAGGHNWELAVTRLEAAPLR